VGVRHCALALAPAWGTSQMQAVSSSREGRRRVRHRHRHSRLNKWLARNAPYIFLYIAGAVVALATTYWLVRDAERSAAQGVESPS
jgi:hypothetical protein